MTEFKVGDIVTLSGENGMQGRITELYTSVSGELCAYVHRKAGDISSYGLTDLTLVQELTMDTTFKIGDKVKFKTNESSDYYDRVGVILKLYNSVNDNPCAIVEYEDLGLRAFQQELLELVELEPEKLNIGDRVRILDYEGPYEGMTGRIAGFYNSVGGDACADVYLDNGDICGFNCYKFVPIDFVIGDAVVNPGEMEGKIDHLFIHSNGKKCAYVRFPNHSSSFVYYISDLRLNNKVKEIQSETEEDVNVSLVNELEKAFTEFADSSEKDFQHLNNNVDLLVGQVDLWGINHETLVDRVNQQEMSLANVLRELAKVNARLDDFCSIPINNKLVEQVDASNVTEGEELLLKVKIVAKSNRWAYLTYADDSPEFLLSQGELEKATFYKEVK